jgi:ATP-binding cassette subfamily F protein 3
MIKKLSNKISKLEKEIDDLEKEIKGIDSKLANPEKFKELSQNPDFFANYEQKQLKLKETEQFWEKANLELDTLKQ